MNSVVNADPAVLAILAGTLCALTLILVVGGIANAVIKAEDRKHLPDCIRAIAELVRSFRRFSR